MNNHSRVAEAEEIHDPVLEKRIKATDAQQAAQLQGIEERYVVGECVAGLSFLQILGTGQNEEGEKLPAQNCYYECEHNFVD